MTYLSYMSNFNQLYNVAKGIANFAKNNFTNEQVLEFCKAVVENSKAQDF